MSYIDKLYAKNAYDMAVNTMHQANATDRMAEENTAHVNEVEDAICDTYADQDTINSEVQDALCEIYEMLTESED